MKTEIEKTIKETGKIESFKEKTIKKASKTLIKAVLESEDDYEARYSVEDLLNKLVNDLNKQETNNMFQGSINLQ